METVLRSNFTLILYYTSIYRISYFFSFYLTFQIDITSCINKTRSNPDICLILVE